MSYFSKTKDSSHLDYLDDYDYYKPASKSWSRSYSKKSWGKSAWSSFSYLSFYEDDDSDLFVKSPESYVTPTSNEIKKKVNAWKKTSTDTIKELARVCYFKMIDEKDYISEKFSDVDNLSDSDKSEYEQKKTFYDTIFDQFIPGFTPLEQAIAIYLKMQKVEYDEDGERIERDDEINMKTGLDFDRELYMDPRINEQLEINELSKTYKMEIMNKISIIGNLGHQFKVEKEVDEKIVANSDEYLKKVMRDYSQFHMIDIYQKMFPNFRTKFLTKDLTVNVPVDRKEQKQKIIILLDFSGSMREDEKQIWVNAILIDRFRYVIKGEAEIFFSYFVDDADELSFTHVQNKEDVIKFWQSFSNHPNGGDTRIGDMVDKVADEILVQKRLMNLSIDLSEEKPEILIINDGQDSVKTKKFPYKTNAISLMGFSDELKNLCIETQGKQVEVEHGNIVTSYSSEGQQLISN